MNGKIADKISIVMPVYNGESTLPEVFQYLDRQKNKNLIEEIIIINDNSTDSSLKVINQYKNTSSYSVQIVDNDKNLGLAANYNLGINITKTNLVITMHQDILLTDLNSYHKIASPLLSTKIAASYPSLITPYITWKRYNFWQKAMFDRFSGRVVPLLSGKFDCFKVDSLKKINLFDSTTFRSAGEDGDLKRKFMNKGMGTLASGLTVVHIHNLEKNFDWKKYLKKEIQIAEAQGVILRIHGIESIQNFVLAFFRQLLLIGVFLPTIGIGFILLIMLYAYLYTRHTFHYGNLRKNIALYLINILILPMSTFYTVKGFILKKQYL